LFSIVYRIYDKVDIKKAILILILGSLVIPVWVGCFYSVPSGDDFASAFGWIENNGNHFSYLLTRVVRFYMEWQGTYFAALIGYFPMYYYSGLTGFRMFLLLVSVVFFILFVHCVYRFLAPFFDKNDTCNIVLIISSIACLYILNENTLGEVFFFYSGTVTYAIPLIFSFLTIESYIQYNTERKLQSLYKGIVFSILATGGALDIAAFLCSLLLLGVLYDAVILKSLRKNWIIMITALGGAIVNSIAPGNFIRHLSYDSEGIRLYTSILYTIERESHVISKGLQNGLLLFVIVVSFVLCYRKLATCTFEFRYPGLITLYAFIAIFVTDFPVVLGYTDGDLPDRCRFVEALAIAIYVVILMLYWAGWTLKRNLIRIDNATILVLMLICVLSLSHYFDFGNFIEMTPYKMSYHIINGDFRLISKKEESILEQIENSKEDIVIVRIERDKDDEWSNIERVGITEDKNYWINTAVSRYYGKKYVEVVYIE